MRASIYCAHCKSPATVRNSFFLSPLLRRLFCVCRNPLCGHTFVAELETIRTLSPSGTPDPDIQLPTSTRARAYKKEADLIHTLARNFLEEHQAEHLSHHRQRLIERCIKHLMEVKGISASAAEGIALQALDECESRDRGEYIDFHPDIT